MAEIKIYGTLKNDTDGVIATTDQIRDEKSGKMLPELLKDVEASCPIDDADMHRLSESPASFKATASTTGVTLSMPALVDGGSELNEALPAASTTGAGVVTAADYSKFKTGAETAAQAKTLATSAQTAATAAKTAADAAQGAADTAQAAAEAAQGAADTAQSTADAAKTAASAAQTTATEAKSSAAEAAALLSALGESAGKPDGLAQLDSNGKVPTGQLPTVSSTTTGVMTSAQYTAVDGAKPSFASDADGGGVTMSSPKPLSGGSNSVTLPVASATSAGVMTKAQATALNSAVTGSAQFSQNSDQSGVNMVLTKVLGGGNVSTALPVASATTAGVMTKAQAVALADAASASISVQQSAARDTVNLIVGKVVGGTTSTVIIPSATASTAGVLSATDYQKFKEASETPALTTWQQDYLKRQEEAERLSKYAVTLALAPAGNEFTGTAVEYTLTASAKYDNKAVSAAVVGTSSNLSGVAFTNGVGKYTLAAPATSNGSVGVSFGVKATYTDDLGSIEKSATASQTRYAPMRFLSLPTSVVKPTSAQIVASTQKQVKASASGSYSITFNSGEYVWVCVPEFMSIKSFTSSGFTVPMNDAVTVPVTIGSTTVNYKCYRTDGAPKTSPMDLDLA